MKMKTFLIAFGAAAFLAIPLVSAPVSVQVSLDKNWTSVVEVEQSKAYAGKSRSSRRSSRKSFGGSSKKKIYKTPKKKKSFATKPSKPAKTYKKGKDPFGKKAVKPKTTAKPKVTSRPKATTVRAPKPKLTKANRTKLSKARTTTLTSPKARTTRLTRQTTRNTQMRSRSRTQVRAMRSERNYWRGRAQYDRNYRYRSYNTYGWGYGYYPGYTYHRGWGMYGYGYTRSGLNIVDMMILYSLFGQDRTSSGTTVVNNYYIDGNEEPADVVAVPQGSYLEGVAPNQILIIKSSDGDIERVPVPAGSTIQVIATGTLIQTPDGTGVLIPTSADEYNAEAGYQVPDNAAQPQEYDEFASDVSGGDGSSLMSWLVFGGVAMVLLILVVRFVPRRS